MLSTILPPATPVNSVCGEFAMAARRSRSTGSAMRTPCTFGCGRNDRTRATGATGHGRIGHQGAEVVGLSIAGEVEEVMRARRLDRILAGHPGGGEGERREHPRPQQLCVWPGDRCAYETPSSGRRGCVRGLHPNGTLPVSERVKCGEGLVTPGDSRACGVDA